MVRTRRQKVVLQQVIALLAIAISMASGSTKEAKGDIRDYFRNGFKVDPNYTPPQVWVANGWIDERDPRITNKPAVTLGWWGVFEDPCLYNLVSLALQQNLSIKEAVAKIDQVEAQRAYVAGLLLPQVQKLSGSYARIKVLQKSTDLNSTVNFHLPDFGGGLGNSGSLVSVESGGNTDNIQAGGLGFQSVWELDFWGKYRRNLEASDAAVQSSISASDAVVVMVTAEVASAYIDYRTYTKVLEQARKDLKGFDELIAASKKSGMTSESLNLNTMILVREVAIMAIAEFETAQAAANNTLCYLCSVPPEKLNLGNRDIPVPPARVAVGIPCDLVRRRPDVVALERIAQVQSAQIGVVEADFYPSIGIGGAIQGSWKSVGNLVNQSSTVAGIGPLFSWTILDYCRTKNRLTSQEMAFEQSVYKYRDAVLKANTEASTAITAYLKSLDGLKALKRASDASNKMFASVVPSSSEAGNIALFYSLGIDAYPYQYILARGATAKALVNVYKTLGGGWESRLIPDSE